MFQLPSSDRVNSECPIQVPSVRLRNKVKMPVLGLGATHSGGYSDNCVKHALQHCNYRLIDTAKRYGTETHVAQSIRQLSEIDRNQVFLITKLWPTDFGFESTRVACEKSCERLQTDYIDLYLVHMPVVPDDIPGDRTEIRRETWRAMESLLKEGKCRAIGVSNYEVADLVELLQYCEIRPHVNQCEFNPYYQSNHVRRFCTENGILFTGYSPLSKGRVLSEPIIQQIASNLNRTPAQVCIRWSLQNGVPAIPKSTKLQRVQENCNVFDFCLSDTHMQMIDSLDDATKKCVRLGEMQHKFHLPDGYKMTSKVSKPVNINQSITNQSITNQFTDSSTSPKPMTMSRSLPKMHGLWRKEFTPESKAQA